MGSLRRDRQRAVALGQTTVTFKQLTSGSLKCNVCKARVKPGKTHGHAKSHEAPRAPRLERAKINREYDWRGKPKRTGWVFCPICEHKNWVTQGGETLCSHCRQKFIAEEEES
jgi:uncharacterized Zn finger protein (UPF0148 family)